MRRRRESSGENHDKDYIFEISTQDIHTGTNQQEPTGHQGIIYLIRHYFMTTCFDRLLLHLTYRCEVSRHIHTYFSHLWPPPSFPECLKEYCHAKPMRNWIAKLLSQTEKRWWIMIDFCHTAQPIDVFTYIDNLFVVLILIYLVYVETDGFGQESVIDNLPDVEPSVNTSGSCIALRIPNRKLYHDVCSGSKSVICKCRWIR